MNQSPMIYVPIKRTDEVDWANPLKRYIQATYQEDPEKYAEEANTIHRLRQDMRGAGKDLTGRDLMYRYYGQLELLELRFPVDENHIRVSFTWYDAFTHKATSQYSLAYEKACTIFNIASILSAIAAYQNRSETDGVKRAFNFFQASAGMYNYINDNFLHAPSTDLSREAVKLLSQLMLTQAQETFLEQSLSGKKKPALIAKLASQTGWSYGNIVENMNDLVTKSVFDKSWLTVCQIKHKYHMSIAQYQKALACEEEGKYGECVGRLNIAETLAKDANKSSNSFVSAFSPTNSPTLPPDAATSLQELTKSNLALITEKKNSATKDNDIVYHDTVPQEGVIPPIEKLNAVKSIPIQELYNNPNDIQKVIGADIFQRLIPLSVHESASLYSEEKAKIVRNEVERCDLANGELEAVLDYMKLPGLLTKFKNNDDARSFNEFITPTPEVKQWANLIKEEEERKGAFKDILMTLQGLKGQSKELMDNITLVLESEQRDFDAVRSKYGDLWSQTPSASLTTVFRQDLLSHHDRFEQAGNSDRHLIQRYEQAMSDIIVLSHGENSDELERMFAEALASFSTKTSSNGENLLDVDVTRSMEDIPAKVYQVEECLSNLHKVKKERMDTLNDLKEKTHQDDISHLLILNKKTQNIEPQLFASELEKFSPYRNRITSSIHHQQALLEELTVFYKNLVGGEEARELQERWDQAERRKKEVCERLKKAKESYLEVKDGLRKGIQFYIDLNDLIENLSKTVHQFAKTRQQEREDLIQSIQNQEELRMKSQLNKLNVTNVTIPNAGSISYDASAHLSEELNKLSLNAGVPTNIYTANTTSQEMNPANIPANNSTFYDNITSPTVQSFSVLQESYPTPSAPSHISPSAPSHITPSAPLHISPSAPSHVIPSAPSCVIPSAPSYVSPSAPSYVSPSAPSYVSPSAPSYVSPSAPSYVSPSAPPSMTGPNSPTSHNPYYSQTSQRSSIGYSMPPMSPKTQGPPVPPLPTEYQQNNVYSPFHSGLHQSQVPPAQQQYSSPVPVVQPQQYTVQTMQRPQPPQMLPTQQPQNFYQSNPIPSQVHQPAVGYYHNSAPPVPIQQANYPPTTGPQQSSHGYQQAPYHTQYRPPPSGNDGPSLLD
ncbi:42773_t:CDS:2 [Gigaspora margarita]|uniref:BRO domain-containing protein 1 n=1 Tax=Gigaspora margarita TaxID=4874 RepID=A0ABN7UFH5_GIGMA|nr:42773_t:CDS:2 [Gigaspora margarita]